tara:strand:+ start:2527 stop:3705 length:1179 start_codon:yes stop_codon:yes gene_type:complete
MKKKRSLWIIKFISISLGISGGFFLFEIFARIIPSTDIFLLELPLYCDNPKSPKYSCIFRREKFINGRFIRGKLPPFPIDVKKSTNDIGQFSNINFKDLKNNDKSILKILSIGDSFVEAMQVSNENTFHGLLNQSKTIDNKKVVSSAIGTAGNAFPQYLVHLYYANEKINLNSTLLIIPIIANDFDESFNKYNSKYAGAKFSISNKEKIFYTSRINNTKTRFKRFLVKNSYMTRYLLLNIKLTEYLTRSPFCFLNQTSPCDDNLITEDESNKEKYLLTDSILATDIFLNNLNELRKTKLERSKTIFVIDSDRKTIYDENFPKNTLFESQRNYFISKALNYGYKIIDMNEILSKNYKENRKRFDFINDSHWNELGHKLVFEEISKKFNLKKQI